MGTLKEYRKDACDYYSKTAGDRARQLAFAGIAIVLVNRVGLAEDEGVPALLIVATACMALGLLFDLGHYAVSWATWSFYLRLKEKGGIGDADFNVPKKINWPGITFMILKVVTIVCGYVFLLAGLIDRLT